MNKHFNLTNVLNSNNNYISVSYVGNFNIIKESIEAVVNNQYESVIIITENDLYKREWDKYIAYYKFNNVSCYSAHEIFEKKEYMLLSTSLLIVDIVSHKFLDFETIKKLFRGDLVSNEITLVFNYGNHSQFLPPYYQLLDYRKPDCLNSKAIVLEFPESLKVPYDELSSTMLKIHDVFKGSNDLVTINNRKIFDNDLSLIFACANGATIQGKYFKPNEICAALARKKGWTVDLSNKDSSYAEQLDLYWNPINIQDNANSYTRCLRARNDILSSNHEKREAIIKYLTDSLYNGQHIVLNTSTKFTEDIGLNLQSIFGDKAAYFHNSITSRFMTDDDGNYITYKTGAKAGKPKKFGKDSIKKLIVDELPNIKYLSLCNKVEPELIRSDLVNILISSSSYDLSTLPNQEDLILKQTSIVFFVFNDFSIDNKLVKSKEITKLIDSTFNQNHRNIWIN